MRTNKKISLSIIISMFVIIIVCVIQLLNLKESLNIAQVKINELTENSEITSVSQNTKENKLLPPAPELALQDHNGKELQLKNLSSEKKKLLVFTSEGCDYCENFYPELDAFSKQYENFEVVVVKYGTSIDDNKQMMEKKGYNFKLLSGTEQTFAEYQIQGTPVTFLLNETNHIVEIAYLESKEQIEEWVFAI
ncbi:TlpA family protein disulfide reductase [Aquimarina sp. 2201CG14-23]|uniref:TlpA family protein disulfide reductase n=1 Tax=Aquimarina mycalae TaxID=3040073 RepID=UPI0024781B35|nr:TlpA disulfide reductase family protein [Aquimarina sp. 2201CG14-23]MDH7444302.1 TlpA disulfide reductase family protein [Aquimarina sp. 2201CG14-23]